MCAGCCLLFGASTRCTALDCGARSTDYVISGALEVCTALCKKHAGALLYIP